MNQSIRSERRALSLVYKQISLGVSILLLAACGGSSPSEGTDLKVDVAPTKQLSFIVENVRPEAFSWLWNNQTLEMLQQAEPNIQSFAWTSAPFNTDDLGYEAAAQYQLSVDIDGEPRTVSARYKGYASVADKVDPENFLDRRPFTYLAMSVELDGNTPIEVLIQYTATGELFKNTAFEIELSTPDDQQALDDYGDHLQSLLSTTSDFLMPQFDDEFFTNVLLTRGSYQVTDVDTASQTFQVIVLQDIHNIEPNMLAWW